MKKPILITIVLVCCFIFVNAQPGELDPSFANSGVLKPSANNGISSIAVQSDGKILIAGENIIRYNSDGTIDSSFNTDIANSIISFISNIAIQNDGKIVATSTGQPGVTLSRYNSDGSFDITFGENGIKTTDLLYDVGEAANNISLLIQNDGKIITASAYSIARFNTNGSLDITGQSIGDTLGLMSSIALQPDGKIVFAAYGSDFIVGRYNTDGSLDKTFSDDGIQKSGLGFLFPRSYAVAIQNDGKIVAAGTASDNHHFVIARYDTAGSLDNTFNDNGIQTAEFGVYSSAYSIGIQHDDKIIVAGVFANSGNWYFAFSRYNTDGSLDSSFSNDGLQLIDIDECRLTANVIIADDKLYAAGTSANAFPRIGVLGRYQLFNGQEPSIRISSPLANAKFTEPATINITALASTAVGKIDKVEFYNGINLLGADDTAPYNFEWQNVFTGNYSITAKAIVNDSDVIASSSVQVSVLPNQPPVIGILTPTNGTTYIAPARIKLHATASDADGSITKVEFYNAATLIQTETEAPYDCIIDSAGVGNYTIISKAYDNDGNVTTSAAVNITVVPNIAPTVSMKTPADHESFTAFPNIILSADADDVDGKIKTVAFYNGNTLLFTETAAPYLRKWFHLRVGNYVITAKATDNKGAVTTSAPVNISVMPDIAPLVSITSPADGTNFTAPATIELSADASDIDGTIKTVDFYNGSTLLFTEKYLPYSKTWVNVPEGNYFITAVAMDNNGKTTTSAPVAISVSASGRPIASGGKLNLSNQPLSLRVNPNPVAKVLNISVDGLQTNNQSSISVLSSSGAVIKTIQSNVLNKNIQLDVSSLSAGVYYIKVINGGKILYKQLVKL